MDRDDYPARARHDPSRPRRGSRPPAGSAPRPERFEQSARDDTGLIRGALTMVEVEERLVRADDELAELTAIHMDLADDAARAEAAWKRHRDTVIVQIVSGDERTAADFREAKARDSIDPMTGKSGAELYERYKITEAAAGSSARAMRSIEARLSAFQTIASNLRKVAT